MTDSTCAIYAKQVTKKTHYFNTDFTIVQQCVLIYTNLETQTDFASDEFLLG